ncbi:hypothetical protein AB0N05_21865 [Nocardia sp. NPDC051030]|uniref:hypothetical protein n=1 Tax=Nocardia sp. NPDC051030 TaxID=3155162 RepID=UPI0034284696
MALLVYYRQIRDDPDETEYWFGESREALSRTLIIDKERRTARTDRVEDGLFRATAARIMYRANREQAWPTHGVIAS